MRNKKTQQLLLFIFLVSIAFTSYASSFVRVEKIANLAPKLEESSGLVYTDSRLWTVVDSHYIALFEISPRNGRMLKEVRIAKAKNRDWEALAKDKHYFYIADIGNNNGTRKNLLIYRVRKSAILNAGNNTWVRAKKLYFYYPEQTSFKNQPLQSNYDAEALLAYKHHLVLFTKNWGDNKTSVYQLPKYPGRYAARQIASVNVNGLITDATQSSNQIYLLGYNLRLFLLQPFIVKLSQLHSALKASFSKIQIPVYRQAEALAAVDNHLFYMTTEAGHQKYAALYKVYK
jgi:hypothetical protein